MFIYRTLFAFVTALFLPLYLFSQATFTFQFDAIPDAAPGKYGSLKVLDMRADKENIGTLDIGDPKREKQIITEQPLAELLPVIFSAMKLAGKNDDELLMVLHHYTLDDKPNGTELGTFYLDADFFGGKNDVYRYIGRVDSFFELVSKRDVTKQLLQCGRDKTYNVLADFAERISPGDSETFTVAQAAEKRKKDKQKFPVYTSAPRKGVYYTVDQFVNNTPVDTSFKVFKSPVNPGQFFAHYINANGKKGYRIRQEDFYAVYDGTDWYISNSNSCVKMQFKNGDFVTRKVFKGKSAGGPPMVMSAATIPVVTFQIGDGTIVGDVFYRAVFDPAIKEFRPTSRRFSFDNN